VVLVLSSPGYPDKISLRIFTLQSKSVHVFAFARVCVCVCARVDGLMSGGRAECKWKKTHAPIGYC
jgi:hypothetical protein